ncbi:MAG: hypothetical protein IJS67_03155, partial [Clostridia bacterium]|nr:hypothetical protein [Clostridia bacterium]
MSIETNGNEILEKLRSADDSLERVKLSEIELSAADNGARFRFVCDKAVSEEVGERVKNILSDYLPERFKRGLTVEFSKLVAD